MFQNLGMQTPNHTVLSELLKSINATVELCKTKLPDQISDNCLACTGRNPALPVPSPNDSKQDLVDPICVDKAITSKNANYLRRKRRIVSLDTSESESEDEQQQKAPSPSSPAMRDPSLSSHAETHIDTSVTRAAGPQTTVQCPLDMQVVPEPFKSSPSKGKKRCMQCNDCHHYSFVRQNGLRACLPDGTKPKIRQCAAWQRFERWRKKPGNVMQYCEWRSVVDRQGPRYAADKHLHDQAVQFMMLPSVERAEGIYTDLIKFKTVSACSLVFMCAVPRSKLLSMYKAEAEFIIDDWRSLSACEDILQKCIKGIVNAGDGKGPPQSAELQMIASATIADELERISTRGVKSWARYTIFVLEYFISRFEAGGWSQETAEVLKNELESLTESIPVYEIECRWQRTGPLARCHHVWSELQGDTSHEVHETTEKIKITDAFDISHPMGNGSSSHSNWNTRSCWGLTLISKDMNIRLMNGRRALTRVHSAMEEPQNGYVTFRGLRILLAEFQMMSECYRRRALISTVYLINARNRNVPPKYLVSPTPTLRVKKIGTILREYFSPAGFGNSKRDSKASTSGV